MFSEHAAAQTWTQVGTLSCRVDPNIGFIIVGHQPMQCVYTQAPGAVPQVPPQSYDGALNTVGLALGVSTGSVLGWAVFAPTSGVPAGALAGEYVGVSADVGLGLGAGANVLLGGSNRTDRASAAIASGINGHQRDRRRIVAQAALALDRAGRSTPVQGDRGFDDPTGTVRVDVDALLAIAGHHDDIGRKSGAFDVKLESVALRVSDCGAAGAAAAFGPAAADLVLVVGGELTDEIEIVAVAGAP